MDQDDDVGEIFDLDELQRAGEEQEWYELILQMKMVKQLGLKPDWSAVGKRLVDIHRRGLLQEFGRTDSEAFIRGVKTALSGEN